MVLTTEGVHY